MMMTLRIRNTMAILSRNGMFGNPYLKRAERGSEISAAPKTALVVVLDQNMPKKNRAKKVDRHDKGNVLSTCWAGRSRRNAIRIGPLATHLSHVGDLLGHA